MTWVFCHVGPVSVVEGTYLGSMLMPWETGPPGLLVGERRGPPAAVEPAASVLIGASGPWYTPSTVSIIVAVSFMVIAPGE